MPQTLWFIGVIVGFIGIIVGFTCVVVVVVCVVMFCLRPRNKVLVAVEYKRKIQPNRISTPAKANSATTN